MALELFSRYFDRDRNKTIVAVKESDPKLHVRYDAELEGDKTDLDNSQLLEQARSWFISRYVDAYATQLHDAKLLEVDQTLEELRKATRELKEMQKTISLTFTEYLNEIKEQNEEPNNEPTE
ncbi:hypothetical protein HO543_01335 [Streptococcus suis]|nr:hypothetical protein [Streptococcus suis]NQJ76017.1 hypothetical protein [Streptococcus suis]